MQASKQTNAHPLTHTHTHTHTHTTVASEVMAWLALLSKEQAFLCTVVFGAYELIALYLTARMAVLKSSRIR